jgi:hypothetical protein
MGQLGMIAEQQETLLLYHYILGTTYFSRFEALRDALDERLDISVVALNKIADRKHKVHFPRFSQVSLRQFWLLPHLSIISMGVYLTVAIILG